MSDGREEREEQEKRRQQEHDQVRVHRRHAGLNEGQPLHAEQCAGEQAARFVGEVDRRGLTKSQALYLGQ